MGLFSKKPKLDDRLTLLADVLHVEIGFTNPRIDRWDFGGTTVDVVIYEPRAEGPSTAIAYFQDGWAHTVAVSGVPASPFRALAPPSFSVRDLVPPMLVTLIDTYRELANDTDIDVRLREEYLSLIHI